MAAASAPAAGGVRGTEVGPLAEIGFAEDDGAGRAQARGDEGVLGGAPIGEGERAGGGAGVVAGFDVVLEQDRDAVQRAAHMPVLAFLIERPCNRGGIGIERD